MVRAGKSRIKRGKGAVEAPVATRVGAPVSAGEVPGSVAARVGTGCGAACAAIRRSVAGAGLRACEVIGGRGERAEAHREPRSDGRPQGSLAVAK